jgi:hypothetical protein
METLKAAAQRNIATNEGVIRRWWIDKYKRPSNDPLYQARSIPEWQTEFYEDLYARRDGLKAALESGDTDQGKTLQALNKLESILNQDEKGGSGDPLIDEWERDLAEGRIPDLDK